MRVNIQGLIDNAKCYAMVRELRWPEQVECPHCHAAEVVKVLSKCCLAGVPTVATMKRNRIVNVTFAGCAIAQKRLPAYVGFFQFVHNARLRINSPLRNLVEALVYINPLRGRAKKNCLPLR